MQALSCFVIICGLLVSSDFAFGVSLGIQRFVVEKKTDTEAAPSEDVMIPVTDELVKKAEDRIAKMQEFFLRNINRDTEESLLENLQNKTTKQLKIMGNKLIQTEEKVVSMGTKDNATIAIYKIINIRPLSFNTETDSEKTDTNPPIEQASEIPDKSSDEPETEPESEPKSEPEPNTEAPENTQTTAEIENQQSSQSDQSAQRAQNNSAQNRPVISILGPDGIPRPIHGIAIKVAPKSDGTEGKNVAFQFFKK